MKTSKVLLMLAAILSFDLSLFQAGIALRPKWSAAFFAPPELLAHRELLLAAGFFTSLVVWLCGLYALSGAGILTRLPFLRLGLLAMGCGFVLAGAGVIPQLLAWNDILRVFTPMILRLVAASFVTVTTGLLYLAGLAFSWGYLSVAKHPAPRRQGLDVLEG